MAGFKRKPDDGVKFHVFGSNCSAPGHWSASAMVMLRLSAAVRDYVDASGEPLEVTCFVKEVGPSKYDVYVDTTTMLTFLAARAIRVWRESTDASSQEEPNNG